MGLKINRLPLRDQIYRHISQQILSGSLPPGSKIKDTDFIEDLEVSRTPVREALLRLVGEGFLINNIGRGFEVASLHEHEIEQTYPIIGALESLALRSSSPVEAQQLKELEKLLQKMEKDDLTPSDYVALDAEWHALLLSGCVNHKLFKILKPLKSTMKRFELAYAHSPESIGESRKSHREILHLLKTGDLRRAADAVTMHWNLSVNRLMKRYSTHL